MGLCLSTLGRPGDAIEYLEFAVENSPAKASFHRWLGDAYLAVGRKHEALEQYTAGLQLWPTNEGLQAMVSQITVELAEERDSH
jgi:tetratricopeptide (TPR) repeat protein